MLEKSARKSVFWFSAGCKGGAGNVRKFVFLYLLCTTRLSCERAYGVKKYISNKLFCWNELLKL